MIAPTRSACTTCRHGAAGDAQAAARLHHHDLQRRDRRYAAGGAPYNMGKAAMEALALTLAKEEAANGVRVNIVAPGLVATDMGHRLVERARS